MILEKSFYSKNFAGDIAGQQIKKPGFLAPADLLRSGQFVNCPYAMAALPRCRDGSRIALLFVQSQFLDQLSDPLGILPNIFFIILRIEV